MKKQLPERSKSQYKYYKKLQKFDALIGEYLALGDLDDALSVTDAGGGYPVVVALGEEPLYYLLERVDAIGGNANVFVNYKNHLEVLSTRRVDAVPAGQVDMSDSDEWENGDASVGAFVYYLTQHSEGVCTPTKLTKGPVAIMSMVAQTADAQAAINQGEGEKLLQGC
ncbi:hypothetical protein KIM372_15680 [Bombiscardovia nodaiensis]|uniref:Uncharacterized protein n=1 Tax=Bombiscardovia nodaiensis TaxID=2932181 RepID=A0ABM8BA10_9BIFI|nr:hypothetical protein KIM372_15680 [Bombiscardovia nodaiensis]